MKLYASSTPNEEAIELFLKKCGLSQLKIEHKDCLNKHFTEEEIYESIRCLKLNKAPGPDGYTPEFYKRLAPLLVSTLTKTCNYVQQHGVLPLSWRNAIISVIPKPNLDHLLPKSLDQFHY